MEEFLKFYSFRPFITGGEVGYRVTGQPMSLLEAKDNVKVLENITGVTKLIKSLRCEIDYLKNENEELYQELQSLRSEL